MILLEKITIKTSQIVTLSPHNGKLPDFSYKSPDFKFSDVLSNFIFVLRITKNASFFFKSVSFGIKVLIETIVSES